MTLPTLRPPPGHVDVPAFDQGWLEPGTDRPQPYLSYLPQDTDVKWSSELESLHEEPSRAHFIDVLTRAATIRALEPATLGERPVIVDLGCSTGHLLHDLNEKVRRASLVGVDAVREGLVHAHAAVPGAALFHASVAELPFADGSVDGAVALNLLEHISDDTSVLRELARVLRPGGRAVVVVPANPRLYDSYDAYLGHERRYARREVARKASSVGLSTKKRAYVGSLVYPGFWAVKKLHQLRPPAHDKEMVERNIASTQASRLGALAGRIEERLLVAGVSLPFGIRELTVLERS
jgi:ubiquinone/menaquinone biosynthesis C-methylase UbiE